MESQVVCAEGHRAQVLQAEQEGSEGRHQLRQLVQAGQEPESRELPISDTKEDVPPGLQVGAGVHGMAAM